MKKVLLVLTFSIVSLFAYDVEKEGNWWYIYNGNDIVGAYSKVSFNGKYSVGCDSPKLDQNEKRYRERGGNANYQMTKYYPTQREAKNTIIKYCKRI